MTTLALAGACSQGPAASEPAETTSPTTDAAAFAGYREPPRSTDGTYEMEGRPLFTRVLAAVRERYSSLAVDADALRIRTAWHPTRGLGDTAGGRMFARFVVELVEVSAAPPTFKVDITAEAAEWVMGGPPRPLSADERPAWLDDLVDELRAGIDAKVTGEAAAAPSPAP